MGIQGLLKALEPVTHDRSLGELSGLRVAIDGYVWLHRGVFSAASSLAKGLSKGAYVSYFVKRVQQLQKYAPFFPGAVMQACYRCDSRIRRGRTRREETDRD